MSGPRECTRLRVRLYIRLYIWLPCCLSSIRFYIMPKSSQPGPSQDGTSLRQSGGSYGDPVTPDKLSVPTPNELSTSNVSRGEVYLTVAGPSYDDLQPPFSNPNSMQNAADRLGTRENQYKQDTRPGQSGMTDRGAEALGYDLRGSCRTRVSVSTSVCCDNTVGALTCGRCGRSSKKERANITALESSVLDAAVQEGVSQGASAATGGCGCC